MTVSRFRESMMPIPDIDPLPCRTGLTENTTIQRFKTEGADKTRCLIDRKNSVFDNKYQIRSVTDSQGASVRFFPIGQCFAGEGQRAFTDVDFQHIPGLGGFWNPVCRQAQV